MGLFNNRFVEGLAARRLVKEFPMISNAFAWLTDPMKPGRKRGLAAIIFSIAAALRGVDWLITQLCEQALIVGSVCSLHVALYAPWFDVLYQAVQQLLVPGAEIAGFLVGVWGLIHARQRNHVVYPLNPLAK